MRVLPELPIAFTRDRFAFRCDSDLGQYAALRAGFGIGFCQAPLGKRDGLVPILQEAVAFELGVWLVMHKDAKGSRRVRALYEHLAQHMKRYLAGQA
jgi:DNA-binding transcriptional LysR family regulator